MPTPALYTVQSTDTYSSLDGKDRRKFKQGAIIDYGDAIKFGMVAAPAALPQMYGGLRPSPEQLSVDDDAVLAVLPLVVTSWPFLIDAATGGLGVNVAETPWPDDPFFLPDAQRIVHLAGATEARLAMTYHKLSGADVFLTCHYSADDRATWHPFGGGIRVDGLTEDDTFANAYRAESDWQAIPDEAKASIWVRIAAGGGVDDLPTSQITPLYLSLDVR